MFKTKENQTNSTSWPLKQIVDGFVDRFFRRYSEIQLFEGIIPADDESEDEPEET